MSRRGKVIEFVDPELEALQKQIAEKLGYRLVDHRMELYGVRARPRRPERRGADALRRDARARPTPLTCRERFRFWLRASGCCCWRC